MAFSFFGQLSKNSWSSVHKAALAVHSFAGKTGAKMLPICWKSIKAILNGDRFCRHILSLVWGMSSRQGSAIYRRDGAWTLRCYLEWGATCKTCKVLRMRSIELAERVGFEPTVRFPARSLSRRVL